MEGLRSYVKLKISNKLFFFFLNFLFTLFTCTTKENIVTWCSNHLPYELPYDPKNII